MDAVEEEECKNAAEQIVELELEMYGNISSKRRISFGRNSVAKALEEELLRHIKKRIVLCLTLPPAFMAERN